jgi:hypothetical protein
MILTVKIIMISIGIFLILFGIRYDKKMHREIWLGGHPLQSRDDYFDSDNRFVLRLLWDAILFLLPWWSFKIIYPLIGLGLIYVAVFLVE